MQLFYCPGLATNQYFLDEEESRHCTKVLRKRTGDTLDICDGAGHFYKAELLEPNPKKSSFKIIETVKVEKPGYQIHIAVSPTKNTDRMEWFIEKATEIGIDKVTFIVTSNSERRTLNLERMKKKAVSAMKQSVRAYLPEICGLENFNEFLQKNQAGQKYLAHLGNKQTPFLEKTADPSGDYLILIGPEGGFTAEEITLASEHTYQTVKIGNYRLRTETAATAACTLLNQINH